MKRHSLTFALGLAILLFGVAGLAQADPITYTQTGIATGTITGANGVVRSFTNASILMTMIGDTDNILGNPQFEDDGFVVPANLYFANPSFATTLDIAGLGLVTITQPTAVYAFPIPVDIDDDANVDPPVVIFGTVDDPPALFSFTGLGGTFNESLAGYHLGAIGPITSVGGIGRSFSQGVNTSLGVLRFTTDIHAS